MRIFLRSVTALAADALHLAAMTAHVVSEDLAAASRFLGDVDEALR